MSTGPNWWVKIGDFGFSKQFDKNVSVPGIMPLAKPDFADRVDIWSLGAMTLFMLFQKHPFPDPHSLGLYTKSLSAPSTMPLSDSISQDTIHTSNSLSAAGAEKRVSTGKTLEGAWLKHHWRFTIHQCFNQCVNNNL
ncbi:hypothetical protein N7495_000665 [Penicillium taxi]|uniref:uncharacterized protein n=1 Tax=Penicillium taxi TaxID=168475 RepID=UPI002544E4FC|nr:uncharacterized protein N7495_000665 [Penicillium taxi]KAJ5907983.1 hypothetical protein N7495_000665 [Penicillium taxi]